ncbi:expressed unknown protein [Seminavis robusta]|uniref:Uncharacterized protein n=1 Tax=Seminavis robusta TaxID=568900 RepID=A0A9N8H4W8_9STRA|nr:expressed unknown protein [Seminavis robusta]|eukprot:Sro14_g010670.1 n/a (333) ;mRNA; f:112464-113462
MAPVVPKYLLPLLLALLQRYHVAAFMEPIPRVSAIESSTKSQLHAAKLDPNIDNSEEIQTRRGALTLLASSALLWTGTATNANAYEKTFPVELDTLDADPRTPRERALQQPTKPKASPAADPIELGLGAVLWGGALWLLTGSRSNPLATPLANVLYSADKEEWLQDRNEGLFAALPAPLLALLGIVFCALGLAIHFVAIQLADGSMDISLQLAGVLLIGGGSLEIGRIASGEKKQTRDDFDRDTLLEQDFQEFAENRLKLGGNCHRSEVVQAFRRYHAKYRQADNPEFPLNDLEIEQLLRQWNQKNAGAQTSAAGFYTGIQINAEADVFVQR